MINVTKSVVQEAGIWCYSITVDGKQTYKQDFDWEQGGLIESEARANLLADKQIAMMKATEAVPRPEQKILEVEDRMSLMQAALDDLILGGAL